MTLLMGMTLYEVVVLYTTVLANKKTLRNSHPTNRRIDSRHDDVDDRRKFKQKADKLAPGSSKPCAATSMTP